jgi:superfamily I DNA/RNA helicase
MIEIVDPLQPFSQFPGPVLLLASPGTGKTYQLAMRIKYLMETLHAKPEEIAVITFTNEAARNMRERISESDINILPENTPEIISTMHSLGNAIIGSKPELFGLNEEYNVLTEDYPRIVLLKDAATLAGFERSNAMVTDECRRKGSCQEDNGLEKCQICAEYRSLLRKCSLVDYDDQIMLACKALRSDTALKKLWQAKTRYLLVDEYQDINEAQYELIRLLTEKQIDGLFAVGDDDQSIYSFRGGSPKYIREFEESFGADAKIGRLSESRRCPEHILRGSRAMVTVYNKQSAWKPEPTFNEKIRENNKIVFYDVPSEKWEAYIIADLVNERVKSNTVTIIIPNGNYFPQIRDALKKRRIAYNYKTRFDEYGLTRLTVLADWIENPENNLLLRYLIDLVIENHDELIETVSTKNKGLLSKRKVASESIASLWRAVDNKKSLYDVLSLRASDQNKYPFIAGLKRDCLDIVGSLWRELGGSRKSLQTFLEKSALFVAPGRSPWGLISEIREWKSERIGTNIGASYLPVNIYNMPSSKGLQADVVFVVGLSDGLIPSPDRDIEEESRLFYVTMTRAKKELYLLSARKRPAHTTFQKKSFQIRKSPFIDAIPTEHIDVKTVYRRKKKVRKGT